MGRRRSYKPPRHPKTGFKTDLLIFCFAAVVLDFLFGVPDKAKQFAEDGLNAAVRNAVRTEVTAGARMPREAQESPRCRLLLRQQRADKVRGRPVGADARYSLSIRAGASVVFGCYSPCNRGRRWTWRLGRHG